VLTPVDLRVPESALHTLRPVFLTVEGDCEPWSDDEIVRRMLIRGAMDYAKAAGRPWKEIQELAASLRTALT
jgi:hypothetical protein